jgi:hypothetical protein
MLILSCFIYFVLILVLQTAIPMAGRRAVTPNDLRLAALMSPDADKDDPKISVRLQFLSCRFVYLAFG